jgi:hypothetical protein
MDTRDVFRALIVEEIRSGRLTAARRRRIVQYAAQLRLSAVETGRLIAECRDEVAASVDPTERRHALRLAEPQSAGSASLVSRMAPALLLLCKLAVGVAFIWILKLLGSLLSH